MEQRQKAKEWLLKGVSKATKEVQLLYAQEKKPINECRASRHLCATFENIIRNGLRHRLLGFRHKSSFWPLLLKISRKQAIKYISSLQHAHSEMGRCRAWIRLAVNECALENYIGVLCQDDSLLNQYYEPYAFLRDQEMREALKYLLIGLSEITFNIDVDTVSLEFEAPPEALQASHLRMRPVKEQQKHMRKRRKGLKKSEAGTTTEGQEEPMATTSTDNSTDTSGEDYDDDDDDGTYDGDYDDETTTTTTTTTGTQDSIEQSPKDNAVMDDQQRNLTLHSQHSGLVVVEDIPRDEQSNPTTSDQLIEQVDSFCHHLNESAAVPQLPQSPLEDNNHNQIVDHFEEPYLDNEQSIVSVVKNRLVSSKSDENSDKITSSTEDKIIDKALAAYYEEVVLEQKITDEFPTDQLYIAEDTAVVVEDNENLQNEGFVGVEADEVVSEKETIDRSEMSEFVEEHYSKEATYKELMKKIQGVQKELCKLQPDTSEHKVLQDKLLELNALLEQAQEDSKCEIVFGHKLVKERGPSLKSWSCDACGHKSRILLKPHYVCQECSYTCHMRCISLIGSTCISSKVGNKMKVIMDICPEMTLTVQQFRCYSCNKTISFSTNHMEPQLCDYTGAYHCSECHHNQTHMIPARVIHNWDFTEYKVCCNCFELLQVISVRPLLQLHKISPTMYTYVQDLEQLEQLRNDFIMMKNYFVDCLLAKEQKLLQKLDQWPHFKENSKLFSLRDLHNVATGDLMVQLKEIHEFYCDHITRTCHVCRSRGIACTLCRAPELLYPFSDHVSICPHCSLLFHKSCYEASQCPQCAE